MNETKRQLDLQWFGDIGLTGRFCSPQVYSLIEKRMARIASESGDCTLRLANFEAPLWGNGGENELKSPRLCTTKEAANSILPLGLNVAFLGNNHMYDCLQEGFDNTVRFLEDHGIAHLGAGRSTEEAQRPLVLQCGNVHVGILNFVHPNTNPSVPADASVFLNIFEESRALDEIEYLSSETDVVLIYLHDGEHEFVRLPSPSQREFGRKAIDAGASVVMFDHAHCLKPYEVWKGGRIFYGLGNFVFGDIPGREWPSLSDTSAMVRFDAASSSTKEVDVLFLKQANGLPDWDNSSRAGKAFARIKACLRAPDWLYPIVYRIEVVYQHDVMSVFRFVRKNGGLIPSFVRIRPKHIVKILKMPLRFLGIR